MILEFSVSNFRSFKELQTLSMVAQPIKEKFTWLKENTFSLSNEMSLLKTKAIFGANASGKSNLIKALATFSKIVINSVKDDEILDKMIEPFILSKDTIEKPSFFQLIFIVDKVRYRYGFEADNTVIKSEWLFGKPGKKEVPFFIREGDKITNNDKKFPEGGKFKFLLNEDNQIVRSNALFLTAAASLNGKVSKKIVNAISQIIIISGINDNFMRSVAYKQIEEEKRRNKVIQFLNESGIDIEDFAIEEIGEDSFSASMPKEIQEIFSKGDKIKILTSIRTQFGNKKKPEGKIAWSFEGHESDGTQKMVLLSPFILDALEKGRVLVLDEFEARLHTSLSKSIVQLFNSGYGNTHKSQFIFSTHDTNLLSSKLMRRDQICFAQKDKFGESKLFSLADIKGVRNDESYEKNYLLGKYDALPKIGNLDFVLAGNN